MNNPTTDFDLLIIGGGLTGLSLACALKNKPLRIGIIHSNAINLEFKNKPQTFQTEIQDAKDIRSIALSYISQRIFQGMQVWDEIQDFATPIKNIHVSNQGSFGFARLSAAAQQVDALGFVVDIAKLTQTLTNQLANSAVECMAVSAIKQLEITDDSANITISLAEQSVVLSTKLCVIADGGHSHLRELLSIPVTRYDYQQTAIVANIGLQRHHHNIAYERFTHSGPLALLPLHEKSTALVLTVAKEDIEKTLMLSEKEFLQQLQDLFGYRLGKFIWVGQRQTFPLQLAYAQEQIRSHTVLIGNACHTLHPIAGQGFNLALRDVAGLAQLIHDDLNQQRELGTWQRLQAYAALRAPDHQQMIALTDNLVKIFSTDNIPLSLFRNMGLLGLDLTFIKNKLAKRTMGFNKDMPDLTLGLPLQ